MQTGDSLTKSSLSPCSPCPSHHYTAHLSMANCLTPTKLTKRFAPVSFSKTCLSNITTHLQLLFSLYIFMLSSHHEFLSFKIQVALRHKSEIEHHRNKIRLRAKRKGHYDFPAMDDMTSGIADTKDQDRIYQKAQLQIDKILDPDAQVASIFMGSKKRLGLMFYLIGLCMCLRVHLRVCMCCVY